MTGTICCTRLDGRLVYATYDGRVFEESEDGGRTQINLVSPAFDLTIAPNGRLWYIDHHGNFYRDKWPEEHDQRWASGWVVAPVTNDNGLLITKNHHNDIWGYLHSYHGQKVQHIIDFKPVHVTSSFDGTLWMIAAVGGSREILFASYIEGKELDWQTLRQNKEEKLHFARLVTPLGGGRAVIRSDDYKLDIVSMS